MVSTRVFRNGSVFDGHRHLPGYAVLVRSGRVHAVLPDAEVDAALDGLAGPSETVDVAGGLVLPGFQDAHVHPVQGGLERIRCDLSDLESPADYLTRVRDYAERHPDRPWVLGGGWSMPAFGAAGPQAADLDAVVGDRPVFLPSRDHHSAWVSSAALRLAGVTAESADPHDGRIERDADGNPSGTLHEGAMALVEHRIPTATDAETDAGLAVAQAYLHSLGVTAWQDAILGEYAGNPDATATYLRAIDAGTLTARVRGALWWERNEGLEQVERLLERRTVSTRGRLDAGSVKVMQDGVLENYTAALSRPYRDRCGHHTGNAGISFVDPQLLREAIVRLDAEGFQVHVHAIGDRAVTETLDAFEAARAANGPSSARHHLAHLQVVAPVDRRRFAELDLTANLQALWAANDAAMTEMTLPFVDEEIAAWHYPFGSMARAGVRLAAGSDWPVSTPDPLAAMHVAVNRVLPGVSAEPLLLDEALTLTEAMAGYTSGSAYVNHLDGAGVLAPGMLADLAVLDRDPFAGPADEIAASRVVATYVDDTPVWQA